MNDTSDPAVQHAALCWRAALQGVEVLLITSRETRRWVIPKGWPAKGLAPHQSAAREAWEEAGVEGLADPDRIGRFGYEKTLRDDTGIPVVVDVFALQVTRMQDNGFPEAGQRKRKWMPPAKAARLVSDPGLATLLQCFDPRGAAAAP